MLPIASASCSGRPPRFCARTSSGSLVSVLITGGFQQRGAHRRRRSMSAAWCQPIVKGPTSQKLCDARKCAGTAVRNHLGAVAEEFAATTEVAVQTLVRLERPHPPSLPSRLPVSVDARRFASITGNMCLVFGFCYVQINSYPLLDLCTPAVEYSTYGTVC